MHFRTLYILGILLLLSGACGGEDAGAPASKFDLIDRIDLGETPDTSTSDVPTFDAGIPDTQTPDVIETDTGDSCASDADCDEGYRCQASATGSLKTCAPEPVEPTGAGLDGSACMSDSDCANGACLQDPEWPGGYCTTVECQTFEDCARGEGEDEVNNRCLVQQGGTNFCVRMCRRDRDCREDYICAQIGGGQGYCQPNPTADYLPENIDNYPFEVTCGLQADDGVVSIDYDIAADTTAYMVTPFARDRKDLLPVATVLPDQTEITYGGANAFQTVPAMIFRFINPLLTPVLARLSDQLQAGAHQLQLETDSQDICYYVLEESSPGTSIDFNVYLVGMGMSAQEAENSPDMQAIMDNFDTIYTQAGVTLGEVRFHEITGEDAEAYQIVRSEFDLQRLVSLSTLPDGGYDGALSANIFFVRGMYLDGGGSGAIGVSEGLPGAAGLHGTPSSGVIFTSEYIGQQFRGQDGGVVDGNAFTGIVMAHEVGHYLGLFHTSEQYGQGFDPVGDTPRCTNPSDFPDGCPDIDNLMFPLAGISHTELSPGQIFTLQSNPLTKD